jgi:hypothetical protein
MTNDETILNAFKKVVTDSKLISTPNNPSWVGPALLARQVLYFGLSDEVWKKVCSAFAAEITIAHLSVLYRALNTSLLIDLVGMVDQERIEKTLNRLKQLASKTGEDLINSCLPSLEELSSNQATDTMRRFWRWVAKRELPAADPVVAFVKRVIEETIKKEKKVNPADQEERLQLIRTSCLTAYGLTDKDEIAHLKKLGVTNIPEPRQPEREEPLGAAIKTAQPLQPSAELPVTPVARPPTRRVTPVENKSPDPTHNPRLEGYGSTLGIAVALIAPIALIVFLYYEAQKKPESPNEERIEPNTKPLNPITARPGASSGSSR